MSADNGSELNDTEKMIVEMADSGFGNKEMADEAGLSAASIATRKTDLKDRGFLNKEGSTRDASWNKTSRTAQDRDPVEYNGETNIEGDVFVNHFLGENGNPDLDQLDEQDEIVLGMVERGDGYGFISDNYPGEDVDERIDRLEEEGFLEKTRQTASGYEIAVEADFDHEIIPEGATPPEEPEVGEQSAFYSTTDPLETETNIGDVTARMANDISEYVSENGRVFCREILERFEHPKKVKVALDELQARGELDVGRKGFALEVSAEGSVEETDQTPEGYPISSTPIHLGWQGDEYSLHT